MDAQTLCYQTRNIKPPFHQRFPDGVPYFLKCTVTTQLRQSKLSQAKPQCLLAIPAFDRIAGLCNRHLNSNRGYAYANDFEVRLRALTDHAKD